MKTRTIDDGIVRYRDDQETRDLLFNKIIEWFFYQGLFNGECIVQSDAPSIDGPELLSDIADEILCFEAEYD